MFLPRSTVRNIPYPAYDVYVYADGDGADSTVANYTVNNVTILGVIGR